MNSPEYLDMAATTPVSTRVADVVLNYMVTEFGNSGSRTHAWGTIAKKAVNAARSTIAAEFGCRSEEVVFTSGATESNNLAIFGLAKFAVENKRMHIISSATEHKAVLEPLKRMEQQGFEVELIHPGRDGRINAADVAGRLRDDTLLVSIMHVNNETGIINDISGIGELVSQSEAFLHVDAAQSFMKCEREALRKNVDLVSFSGHKFGGPKGIGGLVVKRRGWSKIPLEPLILGGGQERGLRGGTAPVALIAGMAEAVRERSEDFETWHTHSLEKGATLRKRMEAMGGELVGDLNFRSPNIANFYFESRDSEALILELQPDMAIATGSACTSAEYTASHVLIGMGFSEKEAFSCVRLSW